MDFLFSFDINRRSSYIDGRSIYYVPPPLYSSALTPLPSTTRQGGTNNNATVEKKMRNSSLPPERDIPNSDCLASWTGSKSIFWFGMGLCNCAGDNANKWPGSADARDYIIVIQVDTELGGHGGLQSGRAAFPFQVNAPICMFSRSIFVVHIRIPLSPSTTTIQERIPGLSKLRKQKIPIISMQVSCEPEKTLLVRSSVFLNRKSARPFSMMTGVYERRTWTGMRRQLWLILRK